jgi:hypothetical protein
MTNVSAQAGEKIKNTLYIQLLLVPVNRVCYEIMWNNMEQPGRPQMTM